eukprot:TRINITY_DN59464_c0_g3_i1.p1 TRINITY_DN59464_c0_g3~~TRINITY_DN59464_c0_g3_i1.p1  ORF type:complete len:330 (-),score=13.82 TRINITY_DN59464_c0_g3_i1:195-1184(-)
MPRPGGRGGRGRGRGRGNKGPPVAESTKIATKMSSITNKIKRSKLYQDFKEKKKEEKEKRRAKDKEMREQLGEDAPPKQIPKTLDNQRTPDPTTVIEGDDEILKDDAIDEWAEYFKGDRDPKILITSCDKPNWKTSVFCKELCKLFAGYSKYRRRRHLPIKFLVDLAIRNKFTDLIIITEQKKSPYLMIVTHLPNGPTATFRMSSVRTAKMIQGRGLRTDHAPEVRLKGFDTRVGHRVGRMLNALFRKQPELDARSIATWHNHRDFIFFRLHRYIFESMASVNIQELGPRFTLRLRSLQAGTFDTKHGEYEWMWNWHDKGREGRRTFFL